MRRTKRWPAIARRRRRLPIESFHCLRLCRRRRRRRSQQFSRSNTGSSCHPRAPSACEATVRLLPSNQSIAGSRSFLRTLRSTFRLTRSFSKVTSSIGNSLTTQTHVAAAEACVYKSQRNNEGSCARRGCFPLTRNHEAACNYCNALVILIKRFLPSTCTHASHVREQRKQSLMTERVSPCIWRRGEARKSSGSRTQDLLPTHVSNGLLCATRLLLMNSQANAP